MKADSDKYPMVYMQWVDPWSLDDWTQVKDIDQEAPLICSIGFLIKETKHSYALALNFNPEEDEVSCTMIIPRNAVKVLEYVE